jgi:hypothetical protein
MEHSINYAKLIKAERVGKDEIESVLTYIPESVFVANLPAILEKI